MTSQGGTAGLRSRAKGVARRALESPAYAAVLRVHDRAVGGTPSTGTARDHVLFVAPGGEGNIGDQSMFEAVMTRVAGPVDVIMLSHGALSLALEDRDRVTVHVMPHLIRGHVGRRVADVRRYQALLQRASRVLIPGADTVDGGNPHTSLTRLNLAHLAREAGVPVSVQGFSWSASAPPSVISSARRLVGSGARLYPRDPVSHRRLADAGIESDLAADLVFGGIDPVALPQPLAVAVAGLAADGRRYVLLNTSGLINRRVDLQDEYARLVSGLHDRGLTVIFTPHVLREPDNDLTLARTLYERLGADGDLLVDVQLAPGQVQVLTRDAMCVITGRMHLAIHALSVKTPALTLATVGKVEGLMEMFDRAQWCIEPIAGVAGVVLDLVDQVHRDEAVDRAAISAALPAVRQRALLNYQQ